MGLFSSKGKEIPNRRRSSSKGGSIGKGKHPASKAPGHDQRLSNQPKGHQAAHFNEESATLPGPDVTTNSSPTSAISGPAKQTQELQENRSDAITAESSTTHSNKSKQSQATKKMEPVNTSKNVLDDKKYRESQRAHASNNSKSSSQLDDQNAYETKPNFPPPDQNFEIGKTDECTPNTEMDAQHKHNNDANKPKGYQGAHFNQGRATLPASDATTKSSPTRPIRGPAKQIQGLQENRSDVMTTQSVSGGSKRERAHASDNSKSSYKNSQNRRNKMMNSSPLDDPNAYETKPNFSSPDQNVQIAKTDECTQNTEKDAQNRHNYDANKGGTSSAHTYHGAANSAILEGQQNSENAMSVFSNKIDERESNVTLETNSNLTISTRQEPCNAIIGVSNCPPQLSEAEMKRKIDELNSLYKSMNKLKIEIENYRDGKGHTRYYYLDDQVLKLMYKVDDVKLDRNSPLRKNKLQLSKDLDQLDDLLKTKA